MPSCVLRNCKNYGSKINKSEGVSYHTFPSNNLIKLKWISIVRAERSEQDWMPTKSSTVCSAHFKQEDKYTTSKGYMRLKKSAVPIIASGDDDVPKFGSPTSLNQVNISDMESVFDSPRKAALKTRVHKLTAEKKTLQKKNNVLKIQNIRLKKTLTNMKHILKDLKKKNYLTEQQFLELNLKAEPLHLFDRILQMNKSKKSYKKITKKIVKSRL